MKKLLLALPFILWASIAHADTTFNVATANSNCTASVAQIVSQRYRNAVTIAVPSGGVTVAIGNAGVTFPTGFQIAPGAALTLQPYSGPVYCITSSATQSVSTVETF